MTREAIEPGPKIVATKSTSNRPTSPQLRPPTTSNQNANQVTVTADLLRIGKVLDIIKLQLTRSNDKGDTINSPRASNNPPPGLGNTATARNRMAIRITSNLRAFPELQRRRGERPPSPSSV